MKHCLPSVVLRSSLGGLLLAALGGCTIFHPYRLPTPKPSPEFKAQQKADAARKKTNSQPIPLFRKKAAPAEEAATDVSTPTRGAAAPTPTPSRTLPERSTAHYDKQGLLKKPALLRRRVNKPFKPFRPREALRNFFKYGRHAKPNYSPDHRPVPKAPQPAAAPDAAPAAAPAPDGKP